MSDITREVKRARALIFGGKEERKSGIPRDLKNQVWAKYFGLDTATGRCYVCKRPIHITDFEAGHNKAKAKGGSDRLPNLRPICRKCNSAMGTTSIEVYKRRFYSKPRKKEPKKKRKTKRAKSPFDVNLPSLDRIL